MEVRQIFMCTTSPIGIDRDGKREMEVGRLQEVFSHWTCFEPVKTTRNGDGDNIPTQNDMYAVSDMYDHDHMAEHA